MTRYLTSHAAVSILICFTASPAAAQKCFKGKVVAVTAGDTMTVLRGKARVTVRLFGVDAPARKTPLAAAARRFTHKLVSGKVVTVKPRTKAKRGPLAAEVSVERIEGTDLYDDGSHRPVVITRFVGEELVNAGLARYDRKEAPGEKRLAALEATARKAKRGVWGKSAPKAPLKAGCYKRCLDRSRTRAMAWSAIQAECRMRCRPKAPPKPARAKSRDPDRACKKDRECVLLYDPCGYSTPPCSDSWKPAANRAADRRLRRNWAIKKPACRGMSLCGAGQKPGRWLGTRAVCVKGQCVAR